MAKRSNIRRRGNSWVVYFRIRDAERGSVQVQKSFADVNYGGKAGSLEAALFGDSLPAFASSDVSDGAAGFRPEDEAALAVRLVPAVERQKAALA